MKKINVPRPQKGRITNCVVTQSLINVKNVALQAVECGIITSEQINSVKLALKRHIKRKTGGKIVIRTYPYKLFTKKPKEVRMGKGKGTKVRYWGAYIRKGKILIELSNVLLDNARKFFHSVQVRLPVKTRIFNFKV